MISEISAFIAAPIETVRLAAAAMTMSAEAFARAASTADGRAAAVAIAFLAGVSEMLGQSVILVANRVALYRFLASLAFTGFTYLFVALVWGLSAAAFSALTKVGGVPFNDVLQLTGIVCLAFAPRLFGVLAIAPYFGAALANMLEVWAMVLVIFGLHIEFAMPLTAAAAVGLAGWGLGYVLRAFLGRLLAGPLRRIRIAVSGSPLDRSPAELLHDLESRISAN